jgi:hypothetical protein
VGDFKMDMGVIEIAGTRFGARTAAKAFRMLLVFWVERGSASRFSFSGLLRIVIFRGGRDWRTEEEEGEESGCASRFSLSGLLRMVMCGAERDWLVTERAPAPLRRMLLGFGMERG